MARLQVADGGNGPRRKGLVLQLGGSDKRIISAVKWVESVSDRMSYIILRGRWCHIIVLNVYAPT
jgi:hypothetical protein